MAGGPEQVVVALVGSLSSVPAERAAYEEALQGWEAVGGFCPLLLQLYGAPPPQLTADGRLLAVLCLKNAVLRHWNARRAGEPAVSDADKAAIRQGLLQASAPPATRATRRPCAV